MKRILFLMSCACLVWFYPNHVEGGVGKIWKSEKRTWVDDTTGYEITQWTNTGINSHPYFTVDSFIDEEHAIIVSDRSGSKQLYKMDLTTGAMTQMTDVKRLRSMDHLSTFKTLWYLDSMMLRSLNTETCESEDIYDFSKLQYHIVSFSVTCDAKWFVFSVNKKKQSPGDCGYGPFAIYKLHLEDTSLTQVTLDMGFNIGHVQTNPVDPNLILFCWQWEAFGRPKLVGHSPLRIWWVNLDGTDGGPLSQEFGTQRTHETWTPDGKNITFVSKYRWGAKKGTHFLGIQSIDGRVNARYDEQVSPGHQNLFKDNKHWIVDQYNNQESLLVMFTRGEAKIEKTTILFRHGSTMVGQDSHPHPRFSPNGKYVLFSSDRTGTAQVYTVRTSLDTK